MRFTVYAKKKGFAEAPPQANERRKDEKSQATATALVISISPVDEPFQPLL